MPAPDCRLGGSYRPVTDRHIRRVDHRLRIDSERQFLCRLGLVAVGYVKALDHDDEGTGLLRRA